MISTGCRDVQHTGLQSTQSRRNYRATTLVSKVQINDLSTHKWASCVIAQVQHVRLRYREIAGLILLFR